MCLDLILRLTRGRLRRVSFYDFSQIVFAHVCDHNFCFSDERSQALPAERTFNNRLLILSRFLRRQHGLRHMEKRACRCIKRFCSMNNIFSVGAFGTTVHAAKHLVET